MKKKKTDTKDDLSYLDPSDDQYMQILDNLGIEESTDSETTDILGFRVINTNNSYPHESTTNDDQVEK